MIGSFITFGIGPTKTRDEQSSIERMKALAQANQRAHDAEEARARAEAQLAEFKTRVRNFDDVIPAMLAYLDPKLNVRYANKTFTSRSLFAHVTGRHISELVPHDAFHAIEETFGQALEGKVVSYERQRLAAEGSTRVVVHLLPDFDQSGAVKGLFMIGTDLGPVEAIVGTPQTPQGLVRRSIYDRAVTDDPNTWRNVIDRLRAAIENDEFSLLAQPLAPMHQGLEPVRDVMVRMKEEEDNRLPPGTYLGIAEEKGLLPTLDRWAIRRLIQWLAKGTQRRMALYAVNIAGCTLAEPKIDEFIIKELADSKVSARCVLLRITEADALGLSPQGRDAMGRLQEHGLRFELSGFGSSPEGFPLLESLPFDFVTIEAGLAISATRDRRGAIKVRAINEAVHRKGAVTIAGPMESLEGVAKIRSLGVDYAQGPAIAPIQPINELKAA